MTLSVADKADIVSEYKTGDSDTGSTEFRLRYYQRVSEP